jgi:hypothetical protein
MQPESNMDVWGFPYFDQVSVVEEILASAPEEVTVAIKANPKTKYEMADAILQFAASHPRVHLLPLTMDMDQAQAMCVGAITICGTAGLEAVFGRGRCVSVRHPILDRNFPKHAAASPRAAVEKLLGDEESGVGSLADGADYLTAIVAQSFPGWISDPYSMPACIAPANIVLVADGLEAGLSVLRAKREGMS